MNFKSFRLFRKTLFVPVIQLRYNKYIQRADGGNDMANTTKTVSYTHLTLPTKA